MTQNLRILSKLFLYIGLIAAMKLPLSFSTLTPLSVLGICSPVWAKRLLFPKIVLFVLFVVITNPVSSHALAKAAHKMGVKPAKRFVMDDYKEDDVR